MRFLGLRLTVRKAARLLFVFCLTVLVVVIKRHGVLDPRHESETHARKISSIQYPAQDVGVASSETVHTSVHRMQVPADRERDSGYHGRTPSLQRIISRIEESGPPVPKENVTRIIVFTQVRSGSTLTAEVLKLTPYSFIVHEPFMEMKGAVRFNDTYFDRRKHLLREVCNCSFETSGHYNIAFRRWLHRKNNFQRYCPSPGWMPCTRREFLSRACERAKVVIVKIVRVHLSQLHKWLLDNADLGPFTVLHLVRDPRAIMASRLSLKGGPCVHKSCDNHTVLCSEMESDVKQFRKMKRQFPTRTFQVRFEDMLKNLSAAFRILYAALRIEYTMTVDRFLDTHTVTTSEDSPYSLVRNPHIVASRWRSALPLQVIERTQDACQEILSMLGYLRVNSSVGLVGPLPMLARPLLS